MDNYNPSIIKPTHQSDCKGFAYPPNSIITEPQTTKRCE